MRASQQPPGQVQRHPGSERADLRFGQRQGAAERMHSEEHGVVLRPGHLRR